VPKSATGLRGQNPVKKAQKRRVVCSGVHILTKCQRYSDKFSLPHRQRKICLTLIT
jgi:hypothetical protein